MINKKIQVTIQKAENNNYDASFVMSAASPDRVKDTIDPKAYRPFVGKKIIALWQHDSRQPFGFWENLRVRAGKLIGDLKASSTNLGQMIRQLIHDGVPLGASIGFQGTGKPNKIGGIHFTQIELLECSVVSVPANPEAVQTIKSLIRGIASEVDQPAIIADSGKSIELKKTKRRNPMGLAEQIEQKQTELNVMKDMLQAAVDAHLEDPDNEDLAIEMSEIQVKHDALEESLARVKKAEDSLARKTVEIRNKVSENAPAIIKKRYEPKEPGDIIFKHATASFIAFVEKKSVEQVIHERYKETPDIAETYSYVQKAQVDPAMTTVAGWAAELVQTDVRGFLASLENVSVAARLMSYATNVAFGGYNSVTIPMENPLGANPTEPAWVAEGAPIPLTQFSFGSQTLNRYKLAAITTFTKELAERATPTIEGLLKNALRKAYSRVLDQALLSNQAAITNVRPAGLQAGVTGATPTAGGGDTAVRGDIMKLLTAMTGAQLGSKPVLVMNNMDRLAVSMMVSTLSEYLFRDELASGQLMGIPVIASANVPQHLLMLIDADAFASAFDPPMFDVSDVATVVESSASTAAPTMASTGAGAASAPTSGIVPPGGGIPVSEDGRAAGAADAGFKARSLWQTYSVGVRMVCPTSWAVLRTGAVGSISPTTWTP